MKNSDIRKVLIRARELIKLGWTFGVYARNRWKRPVSPISPTACCWCARGAIIKASSDLKFKHHEKVTDILCATGDLKGNHIGALTGFNDSSKTKRRVTNLFTRAINKLK